MSNDRIFFYYDPQRQGYDTVLWKTISGTPAISGTSLRVNNASIIHYGDIFKGEITINLTVPVAPVAGQDKKFGFAQLNNGALAYFKVSGDVFTAETANGKGDTESTTITWDAAWTNTATEFKVVWIGFEATFFVNDVKLATHRTVSVPKDPMSAYIVNAAADNLDIKYVDVKNVHNYI